MFRSSCCCACSNEKIAQMVVTLGRSIDSSLDGFALVSSQAYLSEDLEQTVVVPCSFICRGPKENACLPTGCGVADKVWMRLRSVLMRLINLRSGSGFRHNCRRSSFEYPGLFNRSVKSIGVMLDCCKYAAEQLEDVALNPKCSFR